MIDVYYRKLSVKYFLGFSMSDISDRIASRMRELNIKQVDLIERYGFSKGTVSKWVSGTNTPNGPNLTKLATTLKTTESWIISGEQSGSQDANTEPKLFTQIDKNFRMAHIRFSKPDGSRPTVKIPVYRDVKAACGNGFENFLEDPSDHVEMEPMVLKMLGIECKPEHLKIIYSVEDSMWPTVPHDKPLFIDVSDRDPSAIKSGKIYVFTYAYGCRMKRIFMGYDEDEDKRNIRLASDNPDKNEYPDEWISKEQLNEINFVGRLVWTGKEL